MRFGPLGDVRSQRALVASAFFALMGILLLLMAGQSILKAKRLIANSEYARGEVVRIETDESGAAVSVIQYFTPDAYSKTIRQPGSREIGAEVALYYDRYDNSKIFLGSFASLWILPAFIMLVGTLFLGTGLAFVWRSYQKVKVVEWLIKNGRRVAGSVEELVDIEAETDPSESFRKLRRERSLTDGGLLSGPYQLIAGWHNQATDIHMHFLSERFSAVEDAEDLIGKEIVIYFLPNEKGIYYVDLRGLT